MNRSQLEHIIRAAGVIAKDDEIVVIGSQAILGQFPNADPQLLVSVEADVYPKNKPERADLIDGSIGEESPFQQSFGYYAHGVSSTTARLPEGWEERLVAVRNENTRGVTGWCLEVHDLALAKYVAGRPKDLRFTKVLAQAGYVQTEVLIKRLAMMTLEETVKTLVTQRIEADATR